MNAARRYELLYGTCRAAGIAHERAVQEANRANSKPVDECDACGKRDRSAHCISVRGVYARLCTEHTFDALDRMWQIIELEPDAPQADVRATA